MIRLVRARYKQPQMFSRNHDHVICVEDEFKIAYDEVTDKIFVWDKKLERECWWPFDQVEWVWPHPEDGVFKK